MTKAPSPNSPIKGAALFPNECPIIRISVSPPMTRAIIISDIPIFIGSLFVFIYVFFTNAFSLNGFIVISLFRLVVSVLDV